MTIAPSILIVNTSHHQMGDTMRKTGLWLEELSTPYYIFKDAGARITVASIKGGVIPLDPRSESIISATSSTKRFAKDPEAGVCLKDSLFISLLSAVNFDGILLTGGHGTMWDYPESNPLKQLIEDFNRQHKLIGAISNGVCGLLTAMDGQGQLLIKEKQLTAYSNSEEDAMGLSTIVPFMLESRLVSLGASYSKGPLYTSHSVTDGNLITGQNPSSSGEVARNMLAALKKMADSPLYSMAAPPVILN